jgi:hypothetical protein
LITGISIAINASRPGSEANAMSFPISLKIGALMLFLSGATHFLGAAASGFAPETTRMLVFSAVYPLLGIGLLLGGRWLGYAALVLLLLGLFSAIRSFGADGAVPDWSRLLIVAANLAGSIILAIALLRKPKADSS